ncbi:MAG: zinc dependent phospholipase C family protein [Lachnospiraceae bacterium]|nr:zinc dependent phospholipase C family protein [Lachnospiraceae bacterium]
MAGTMVHLVIADILAQEWAGTEIITPYGSVMVEYDYFIAGNICPDGIMARKGYVREMKKHTHFRDNINDGDFHKKENIALFHKRLESFMKNSFNSFKTDSERSLYLGYWVHMLADEMFVVQIRPEFLRNISITGLTEKNMETFKYFSMDVDMVDFRIVNQYEGIQRIYNALSEIKPYKISGMVTEDELTDSRNWILQYFFETEHTGITEPVYISYNRMIEFIKDAASKISGSFK